MKKITKNLIALLLAAALVLTFSACSSDDSDSGSKTNTASKGSTAEDVIPESKGSKGLKYELINNGTAYAMVGLGTTTDKDIVIPGTYQGKPVLKITEEAFGYDRNNENSWQNQHRDKITSITISESITHIHLDELRCDNLNKISIPNSVQVVDGYIDEKKVAHTEYKNGIYFGNESNPYLVFIDAINKSTLTDFEFHPDTKIITGDGLEGSEKIKIIIVPDKVIYIGSDSLRITNLKTLTLPKNLKLIQCPISCDTLLTINYKGTKAQWNVIHSQSFYKENKHWDNKLNSYTVKCTDGTISVNKD